MDSSRLDFCQTEKEWLQIPSDHRPPRLPGKTPGEYHGCVCRSGQGRSACYRNGYSPIKRWGCGHFSCESRKRSTSCTKSDWYVVQDATLKRCYGKENKIIDCNWDFLSEQRTLKEPHVPMPRLKDLLEYLASPGLENIWLLLDIKVRRAFSRHRRRRRRMN